MHKQLIKFKTIESVKHNILQIVTEKKRSEKLGATKNVISAEEI